MWIYCWCRHFFFGFLSAENSEILPLPSPGLLAVCSSFKIKSAIKGIQRNEQKKKCNEIVKEGNFWFFCVCFRRWNNDIKEQRNISSSKEDKQKSWIKKINRDLNVMKEKVNSWRISTKQQKKLIFINDWELAGGRTKISL